MRARRYVLLVVLAAACGTPVRTVTSTPAPRTMPVAAVVAPELAPPPGPPTSPTTEPQQEPPAEPAPVPPVAPRKPATVEYRVEVVEAPTSNQGAPSVDVLPPLLRRIAGCESSWEHRPWGEPVWDRENMSGSSASGGLQILDSTWRAWAARYGADVDAPAWPRAKLAPPDVQIAVGVRAFADNGSRPWAASHYCWA